MSKLSKKNFLNNYSSHSELHKELLEQGEIPWKLIREYPQDYYNPISGSVTGLIYYQDTIAFGKKHHLEILKVIQDLEEEYGRSIQRPKPTDESQYFNFLTWFAWESMMGEVMSYLGR